MARAIRKKWSKTDKATGERIHGESKIFYAEYNVYVDGVAQRHYRRGSSNEAATTRLAVRLEEEAALHGSGLMRFAEHHKRPLAEHIEDFQNYLSNIGG